MIIDKDMCWSYCEFRALTTIMNYLQTHYGELHPEEGYIGYNESHGNVYWYNEDIPYSIYCGLDNVLMACYSNPENDKEISFRPMTPYRNERLCNLLEKRVK